MTIRTLPFAQVLLATGTLVVFYVLYLQTVVLPAHCQGFYAINAPVSGRVNAMLVATAGGLQIAAFLLQRVAAVPPVSAPRPLRIISLLLASASLLGVALFFLSRTRCELW